MNPVTAKSTGPVIHQYAIQAMVPMAPLEAAVSKKASGRKK